MLLPLFFFKIAISICIVLTMTATTFGKQLGTTQGVGIGVNALMS